MLFWCFHCYFEQVNVSWEVWNLDGMVSMTTGRFECRISCIGVMIGLDSYCFRQEVQFKTSRYHWSSQIWTTLRMLNSLKLLTLEATILKIMFYRTVGLKIFAKLPWWWSPILVKLQHFRYLQPPTEQLSYSKMIPFNEIHLLVPLISAKRLLFIETLATSEI